VLRSDLEKQWAALVARRIDRFHRDDIRLLTYSVHIGHCDPRRMSLEGLKRQVAQLKADESRTANSLEEFWV
jgi:hypothetical protein